MVDLFCKDMHNLQLPQDEKIGMKLKGDGVCAKRRVAQGKKSIWMRVFATIIIRRGGG